MRVQDFSFCLNTYLKNYFEPNILNLNTIISVHLQKTNKQKKPNKHTSQ